MHDGESGQKLSGKSLIFIHLEKNLRNFMQLLPFLTRAFNQSHEYYFSMLRSSVDAQARFDPYKAIWFVFSS